MKEVSFEDCFGLLVDTEYTNRKNNRLKRLIKNAQFDQPSTSVADIDYTSGRKLNKNLIKRLASCDYIADYRNMGFNPTIMSIAYCSLVSCTASSGVHGAAGNNKFFR